MFWRFGILHGQETKRVDLKSREFFQLVIKDGGEIN